MTSPNLEIHQLVQSNLAFAEIDLHVDRRLQKLIANDRRPHFFVSLVRFHLEASGQLLFDRLNGSVRNDERDRSVGVFKLHVECRRDHDIGRRNDTDELRVDLRPHERSSPRSFQPTPMRFPNRRWPDPQPCEQSKAQSE